MRRISEGKLDKILLSLEYDHDLKNLMKVPGVETLVRILVARPGELVSNGGFVVPSKTCYRVRRLVAGFIVHQCQCRTNCNEQPDYVLVPSWVIAAWFAVSDPMRPWETMFRVSRDEETLRAFQVVVTQVLSAPGRNLITKNDIVAFQKFIKVLPP